jgi:aspartokinase
MLRRIWALKKKLSVAKFGGSLLDVEGKGFPKILKRIKELKARDAVGPIVVFSAPMGCTDALIRIGESYAQSISAFPLILFSRFMTASRSFMLKAVSLNRQQPHWLIANRRLRKPLRR